MAMELIFARQVMGRPYLAPPDIPAERHEALRRAFDSTTRDPDFRADAERLQLELNPVSGEEVDALITRIYGASDSAVRLAADAITKTDRLNHQQRPMSPNSSSRTFATGCWRSAARPVTPGCVNS